MICCTAHLILLLSLFQQTNRILIPVDVSVSVLMLLLSMMLAIVLNGIEAEVAGRLVVVAGRGWARAVWSTQATVERRTEVLVWQLAVRGSARPANRESVVGSASRLHRCTNSMTASMPSAIILDMGWFYPPLR